MDHRTLTHPFPSFLPRITCALIFPPSPLTSPPLSLPSPSLPLCQPRAGVVGQSSSYGVVGETFLATLSSGLPGDYSLRAAQATVTHVTSGLYRFTPTHPSIHPSLSHTPTHLLPN